MHKSLCLRSNAQSHFYFFFKVLQMNEFLKSGKFIGFDFVQSEKALGSPSRQFDSFNFLFGQSVFDAILLNSYLALVFGGIVAGVYDKIVFASDADLLHVILKDLLKVQMQTHEIAQ